MKMDLRQESSRHTDALAAVTKCVSSLPLQIALLLNYRSCVQALLHGLSAVHCSGPIALRWGVWCHSYLGMGDYGAWSENERIAWLVQELESKRPLIPPSMPMTGEVKEVINSASSKNLKSYKIDKDVFRNAFWRNIWNGCGVSLGRTDADLWVCHAGD